MENKVFNLDRKEIGSQVMPCTYSQISNSCRNGLSFLVCCRNIYFCKYTAQIIWGPITFEYSHIMKFLYKKFEIRYKPIKISY